MSRQVPLAPRWQTPRGETALPGAGRSGDANRNRRLQGPKTARRH